MAILSIARNFNGDPNIVTINSDDNLTALTTAGYWELETTVNSVAALQNGVFEWAPTDLVLIYYSSNQIGFFTFDATTNAFVVLADNGNLSNSLASAHIFVGNASNIATGVAMSGDATMSNTGVLTIGSGAVTGSKIANNAVDYTQLAQDVAISTTVSLTAAQILGMYATPVQLIAAPGSGKLILIDNIIWDISFGSAQYAAGGAIAAQYGNTAQGNGPTASGSIPAASLNGVGSDSFLSNAGNGGVLAASAGATENAAIYLSNQTAAFTTGDSTVTLYIRYRIITPA